MTDWANGAVQSPDIELAGRSWGPAETRDTRNAGWDPGIAGDRIFTPDAALFLAGTPIKCLRSSRGKKITPCAMGGMSALNIQTVLGYSSRTILLGPIPRLAFRRSGERHEGAMPAQARSASTHRWGRPDAAKKNATINIQHPGGKPPLYSIRIRPTRSPRTSGISIATRRNQPRSVRPVRANGFSRFVENVGWAKADQWEKRGSRTAAQAGRCRLAG